MGKLRPALFVDRDGTLIDNKGHLSDPDGVEFFPGVAKALRAFSQRKRRFGALPLEE